MRLFLPTGANWKARWFSLKQESRSRKRGVNSRSRDRGVAATDLFPFANQCPRQEIRSLTDQSTGRVH